MYDILAVAVGGAMGATARFLVVNTAYSLWGRDFPWGVFIANATGSFLLGLLGVLLLLKPAVSNELRLAILVGALGAFTTFSTFTLDTLTMLEEGAVLKALANILANVCTCLLSVWGGVWLARHWQ